MPSYQCRGKNKLWSVRFTINENGEEIQKRLSGYARKKDAEQGYVDFINEYKSKQNQMIVDTNVYERSLDSIFEEFKVYKKTKVKDSSFYDIVNITEQHILPFFKGLKLKDITKKKILDWQKTIDKFGYKYKSKIRTVLFSIYRFLSLYYDVDNVVARVEGFKKPDVQKEMNVWSLEDFNKFIDCIEDDILYKAFFTFMYFTGCRKGEGFALSYKDFNFQDNSVKITKSLTTKIYDRTSDAKFLITSPKNASSNRTIYLSNNVIDIINEYLNEYPDVKNERFMFGGDYPLNKSTVYRKLEYYANLAGIKKIRLHDFRHSHVSLLISKGADIVLIAKRLGHSNTQQTLNTYAHLFPNAEKSLIEKLSF